MSNVDAAMYQFMIDRHVPNAAVAIVKDGRLVFARGYTNAPTNRPVTTPNSLFRLASLSKPLTSVGVMTLVESGAIAFDQPISTILDTSDWTDPRIDNVTVRDLLQHRGGWDVSVSGFDPMTQDFVVTSALNESLPMTPVMAVEYMKTQPLDVNPGSTFAYSNFGYCMLGRIIESVTGQPYDTWIKANVLSPVGAQRAHLSRSELGRQWAGEVPYVDEYQRVVPSVMGPTSPALVPLTYGGWNLHTLDASGGWVTSVVEYARFLATFNDLDQSPLLNRGTIEEMWSRPPAEPPGSPVYYASGFLVQPLSEPGHIDVTHTGANNGTSTWLHIRDDHVQWVVMMNVRGIEELPPMYDLAGILDAATGAETIWPDHDLFSQFSTPNPGVFINVLLGIDIDPLHAEASDLNADGKVDARDIAGFVQTLAGW
ncbi:MAG: serine hydrolase domain-containing protein [Planctomycetota bacterium]